MITRAQYLDNGAKWATHDAYYLQFVDRTTIATLLSHIKLSELKASTDPHLNDIALKRWDRLPLTSAMLAKLREAGDVNANTLGNSVCIYKRAAKLVLELADDPRFDELSLCARNDGKAYREHGPNWSAAANDATRRAIGEHLARLRDDLRWLEPIIKADVAEYWGDDS